MKIDMSSEAITRRLGQVDELRRLTLSLARSSVGREVAAKNSHNKNIQRTRLALGET